MPELQEQEFNDLVAQDVKENVEILKYEPEGNLTTVNLRDELELLPEVSKSYRAIFGDKPWGVLKDSNGDLVTWAEADELLKKGEGISFDEAYTPDEVTKLLTNWVNLENSHITVEKDEKGRVFSLLAWFEHDSVEGVVGQIERENYEGNDEWSQKRKPELLGNLRKNSYGKLVYVADMAKLPSLRKNIWHTLPFWFNMMKEFTIDYYDKDPHVDGMTVTFRTSTKSGAPLDKQIGRVFPNIKPAYKEADDIAYYLMQEDKEGLVPIIKSIKDGSPSDLFESLSRVKGERV